MTKLEIELAVVQCSAVKRETYKLRQHIMAIPHDDNRKYALQLFQKAYEALDTLQEFIRASGG